MANDLTRDFFQNLATTVSPDTHDDILKIGNVFTGSKYLATTTANFAKMHRRKLAAEIKAVNVDMDVDACIEMMETALKCKFPDPEATPMTAAMRGARRQRGVRAGHARLPRFIPRGMAFETLGEKLARLGQLDTLTLPRTFGNYVRMVNSKMTKKHVRRITRDVRAAHAQPASCCALCSALASPLLSPLSLLLPPDLSRRLSSHRSLCSPSQSSGRSTPTPSITARSSRCWRWATGARTLDWPHAPAPAPAPAPAH